jgi:hypothetical protein
MMVTKIIKGSPFILIIIGWNLHLFEKLVTRRLREERNASLHCQNITNVRGGMRIFIDTHGHFVYTFLTQKAEPLAKKS